MAPEFEYFVVLAEMRTGSNLLESHLNAMEDIICHGEAFNPHFIGYPKSEDLFGITLSEREENPANLIATIRSQSGKMAGFRFFHDHDPRALNLFLDDPKCAKIILTRNPLESYISLKIARSTGQWKLTNIKRQKEGVAHFDRCEFEDHVSRLQMFQKQLLKRLQTTGQTAFYISYEDLSDVDIINGLATFLGTSSRLTKLEAPIKPQNPRNHEEKVVNHTEMRDALSQYDAFNLSRTPNFEPRRGAAVPGFIAGKNGPLLYIPLRGGLDDMIAAWMAKAEGGDVEDLQTGLNQKMLRDWLRMHASHRTFCVTRHPVARAHTVFCTKILNTGAGGYSGIRQRLRNFYKVPLPGKIPDDHYTRDDHAAAFKAFLKFLRANLAGQTSIRVDGFWASQSALLQGASTFVSPDHIFREEDIVGALPALAQQFKLSGVLPTCAPEDYPYSLSDIYDEEIESLVATVYQRDYLNLGFKSWR